MSQKSRFAKARRAIIQRQNARSILNPFAKFLNQQATGGIFLFVFSLIAIAAVNIPSLQWLHNFWDKDLTLTFNFNASFLPLHTVREWVNSMLMAIFFFFLCLEIKREMVVELFSPRSILLPILAAIGGLVVPAAIYFACAAAGGDGAESAPGWGITTATGLAFTICMLSLLKSRISRGVKVFIISVAIIDTLITVIISSIAYPSHTIYIGFLIAAALIVCLLALLNRFCVNYSFPYFVLGILLWFFMLRSGIHAATAGIILALAIPSSIKINQIRFYARSRFMLEKFKEAYNTATPLLKNEREQEQINNVLREINKVTPLILRAENAVYPWVHFCIMPIFALANIGIIINAESVGMLTSATAIGIFLGLVIGKPAGIMLMSFIAVKLKLTSLPEKAQWVELLGVSVLAGMGFSMSIFAGTIAFSGIDVADLQNLGKLAALIATLFSAVCGYILIIGACKKHTYRNT
ncbi:MAG: Na+/H+ antiporter NhaA [Prevotellaceae bacterium]|jgi:NhaA family Na+:H+ antiporter|nr:Na+/H+ antiporter NhaA [Prevotellaceae bacterium]